ncbi:zinc finger protein-like [Tropilaelaps mercedesae]|uniref:Zinc finger protein-like n=1 Tax=Tropilaelaps mercedesae TaxID=418985 RepID=A0A1V9XJU8_9ACAR|nr:zinc finger protein-like [Tropilaelaps mercedesae]
MILSDTEKLAALGMIPLLEGITSAGGGNHHASNNHHVHSSNSVVVSSHNGDSPVGSGSGGGCGGAGGWRYRCKYCTYTTESKTVFNAHQRTHTGDRPYRCRFCAYAAKQKSHVTLHERLHTGEKPYSYKRSEKIEIDSNGKSNQRPGSGGQYGQLCREVSESMMEVRYGDSMATRSMLVVSTIREHV